MRPDISASASPPPLSRTRLTLWSAGYLVLAFPLVYIAYQGLPIPMGAEAAIPRALLVAIVLLLFTWALMRREGRAPSALGLSFSAHAAKHLVMGIGAGALLFTAAALLIRMLLPFHWELNPTILPSAVMGVLFYHLATNACEELAWRGYAFDGLLRALGHWPAQVIVALVAACFHVLSGWSWQQALISTTSGSLLFALVFLRWRSVPAAIGVHAAWNWTRDLILMPESPKGIWHPIGTEHWTIAQWNRAQAVLVGVTLLVSVILLWSLRRKATSANPQN